MFAHLELPRSLRLGDSALAAVRLCASLDDAEVTAWVRGLSARRAFELYCGALRFERLVFVEPEAEDPSAEMLQELFEGREL